MPIMLEKSEKLMFAFHNSISAEIFVVANDRDVKKRADEVVVKFKYVTKLPHFRAFSAATLCAKALFLALSCILPTKFLTASEVFFSTLLDFFRACASR